MGYEQNVTIVVCVLAVAGVVLCAIGITIFLRKLSKKMSDQIFDKWSMDDTKAHNSESIWHLLAPSLMGICLCVVCLCGTSWAWFTASRSSSVTPIQTANYTVALTVDGQDVPQTLDGESIMKIQMSGGQSYAISFKANGTASTGYCKVTFEGKTYYTNQIGADDTFSFTVNTSQDSTMEVEAQWGTCALESVDEITSGAVIGEQLSQSDENNTPDDIEDETIESESETEEIEESQETETESGQDMDTSNTDIGSDMDSDMEEDMPSMENLNDEGEPADIEDMQ